MAVKDLLLLLAFLATLSIPVDSQSVKDTCQTKDTAIALEPNLPSDVQVLGVYQRACYQFYVPESGLPFVVALVTDAENPQMYLLSPTDGQVAPYPDYNMHSVGGQIREVLTVKGPDAEAGTWQVSVVNINNKAIVYTLTVFLTDPNPVPVTPGDKTTYQAIYDTCCSDQGACSTWKLIGGRDADPCGLPGFRCNSGGSITAFQIMGTPAGLHMTCAFPADLFAKLQSLDTLLLRWHPDLRGSVNWTALATLQNLKVLDLSYTALSGPIGCDLSNGKLTSLDLSSIPSFGRSKFTGPLPACYLMKQSMKVLRLSWNKLTGNLPDGGVWTNTSMLEWVALDHNQLGGELPGPYDQTGTWVYNGLGRLPHLRILQLNDNQFWGHVPESLNQPSLLQLDLSNNALTYIVSDHILGRPTLRSLRLSNNQLNGQIPSAITSMTNLTELLLDNNKLTGPLPSDWSKMQEMVTLTLNNNGFEGQIPQSLMGMRRLVALDISNNRFSGPIPDIPSVDGTLQVPTTLATLAMENNTLTGNFPPNFQQLPAFQPNLRLQTVAGNYYIYEYSFARNALKGPLPDFMLPPMGQDTELNLLGNDALECPEKFGTFAGIECTAPNPVEPSSKISKVGLAFLVIGIVGGVALIAAAAAYLIMHKRKHRRHPAPELGEVGSMPKDGSKSGMGHKLYRLLTQKKEPSYVKFAGDQDTWGLARVVGG